MEASKAFTFDLPDTKATLLGIEDKSSRLRLPTLNKTELALPRGIRYFVLCFYLHVLFIWLLLFYLCANISLIINFLLRFFARLSQISLAPGFEPPEFFGLLPSSPCTYVCTYFRGEGGCSHYIREHPRRLLLDSLILKFWCFVLNATQNATLWYGHVWYSK